MRTTAMSATKRVRRHPLATGIASFFALSGSAFAGATLPVTSCLDDNVGQTLRVVIACAASGDTVDLSGLTCPNSIISLQTAQISVTQDDLTIKGPGAGTLAISGASLPYAPGDSRLFRHTGGGTLTFRAIGLKNGHIYHDSSTVALGACVYSNSSGGLELYDTIVASCSAYSTDGYARGGALFANGPVKLHGTTITKGEAQSANDYAQGGGIWANGDVLLDHSSVSGNTATAPSTTLGGGIWASGELTLQYGTLSDNVAESTAKAAQGGGAFVYGAFTAEYSTVSGNAAHGAPGFSYGGGIISPSSVALRHSTVSGNSADGAGGGIVAIAGQANANTLELKSSTISGNTSARFTGGVLSDAKTVLVYNTTVAFNGAAVAQLYSYTFAPGLALSAIPAGVEATLQSSLFANNLYDGGTKENDLSTATTLLHPVTFDLASANNFVRAYTASGLPPGTINKVCPLLGPLRDNGGPTWTHALFSTSPGIDAGNNVLSEAEDQRGVALDTKPLPYPRESPDGAPDIGAYEINQDEIVFDSGFDGCIDT
jgi:hypothetical protein